jgi:hypothetical protein
MSKLLDCLNESKQWYEKAEEQAKREHSVLFTSPVAIGTSAVTLAWGGPLALVSGLAVRALVGGAYGIGKELGNAQGYDMLKRDCYSKFGV